MKHYKTGGLALACVVSLCLAACGTGAQVGGAVDRGLDMEGYTREEEQSGENGQTQESTDGGDVTDINSTSGEGAADGLNELGLDPETMDLLKFNIYVQLNNTIVEIMDDINNYFLVVDTAEEFRFREDAEYSYGYRITGFNMDAVEDAEVVCGMEPAFETLDGLVESMLPSMREIIETFNAIDDSEYTYEENQYQQPKDNHIRLMAKDILHLFQRHQKPGRGIGVGENNTAVLTVIILRADGKIRIQRRCLIQNPEQFRPNLVKRIADIRKQNRLLGMKEGQKSHRQHIIRTHSHKYLIPSHTIVIRQTGRQLRCCRIRIFPQLVIIHLPQRLRRLWCRRVRILIRVQFDQVLSFRLFPRHIRNHPSDIRLPCSHALSSVSPYSSASFPNAGIDRSICS